ncbi:MAG: hypothetical protein E3K32_00175 [wastewater metagenome]|nr:hypothetical protein [Candidatus Loosdrechtia aerotolerans]
MWLKWLPWRFLIKHLAHSHGFLDPFQILSRLSRFAQPSEVMVPVELLRAGALLHARGLINSQAIQHNLDWIWPYWVEQQFNPRSESFIPRAFSLTHINLTHRNWTAVGIPDFSEMPIVDPRGLVTPVFDGWSFDSWIVTEGKESLLPSRLNSISQNLLYGENLVVVTKASLGVITLESRVMLVVEAGIPICRISLAGHAESQGWIVASLRPFNPEGISFIHDIALLSDKKGWRVNKEYNVLFSHAPGRIVFSDYQTGDVYHNLFSKDERNEVQCDVGMATAAALFKIQPGSTREITVDVPLKTYKKYLFSLKKLPAFTSWEQSIQGVSQLSVPDERFQFLYESVLRTLILHSSDTVYAGPYTYKRFWFRDAAFILHALLCTGLSERVERVLDLFPSYQTTMGYFRSQEGEWDSNGQVLWIIHRFCELTGKEPKAGWRSSIRHAGRWIQKKRLSKYLDVPHAGLFPPGFSAEHLGPSDYYYWDNFWNVMGLRAAASLMDSFGEYTVAEDFRKEASSLLDSIDCSLRIVAKRIGSPAMPASPYRRLDSGAIGSLAAGYPLQLWDPQDPRLLSTVTYLMNECLVDNGFFHDMIHSGINPYLTLHIAQVLLRAGDCRFFNFMKAVANLATSTGQWPEAIHPNTGGGCMGDGQHVWAAAEWVLMIRNCFVREEGRRLILCSGIPAHWYKQKGLFSFGPVLTSFGKITITISSYQRKVVVNWDGVWHKEEPQVEIWIAGHTPLIAGPDQKFVELEV